jgi:decaprenylphospho-beta-D-erythro-pentofuranosid-2-ulose 2-reductase
MNIFPNGPGHPPRIMLLGGTSEIGLAILAALAAPAGAEVILAGRNEQRLAAAGKELPYQVRTVPYDAVETGRHQAFVDAIFAEGPLDMVISAAGVLVPQEDVERDVQRAAGMIETNFTGHVTSLLAVAARMRAQGHGTIVVLSSVAAVRPRKANFVYGAAKAGLDAFARGLTDSLHGTGVRVLLVRPGFVTGRMTAGMPPAPMATTPEQVGVATAAALRGRKSAVWIPAPLGGLAVALRLIPRPAWRRVKVLAPGGRPPEAPRSWGETFPPRPPRPPLRGGPISAVAGVHSEAVRVLVAEDDESLGAVLARGLREQGYVVDLVPDGETAAAYLRFYQYEVAVLDWRMPRLSGLDLVQQLRRRGTVNGSTPVLMLTARDTPADRIAGLDAGADDYLVKPFDFGELLARLRALQRRPPVSQSPRMTIGEVEFDPAAREVLVRGERPTLTGTELGILEILMRRSPGVADRRSIAQHVWDNEADAFGSNTIDVHLARLRSKLAGAGVRIETVRGVGYRITPQ